MPTSSTRRGAEPRPGTIERLYAYWLISTALLVLVVIIGVIVTRGMLHRQMQTTDDLARRVAALEGAAGSEKPGAEPPRPAPLPASTADLQRAKAERVPEAPQRPPATAAPRATKPAASPAAAPSPPPLSGDALQVWLDEVLDSDPATPADVVDTERATTLLDTALRHAAGAAWGAGTWARLAVLALLLGRDAPAQSFADRAAASGDPLTAYHQVATRALLTQGRAAAALPVAKVLLDRGEDVPTGRVLLAAALVGTGELAAADELLTDFPLPASLHVFDQLLLARILLILERWEPLDEVLSAVRDVPPALAAEHNFLRAVGWARAGRRPEALAVLDGLAVGTDPEEENTLWLWPRVGPDRYEIQLWRGVTLLYAHQAAAARETLRAAAEMNPERGEAQMALGQLEARAGRVELALVHLKNAVASAERLAPAWEALAALELDANQVPAAREHAGKAAAINPRRASAHFLTALADARLGRASAAADALRRTFALEPSYLDEATQAEVLLRLFSVAEMEALASPPPEPPESAPLHNQPPKQNP